MNLQKILNAIRYKPNVTMEIRSVGQFGMSQLVIRVRTPDVHTGRPTEVNHASMFDASREFWDERDFVEYVHGRLRAMEIHECDEWFRFNGAMLFDPHRERNTEQHA